MTTPEEDEDIRQCKINYHVIDMLCGLGTKLLDTLRPYSDGDANNLVGCAIAIGTIIKEYDWGIYYLSDAGLYKLVQKLVSIYNDTHAAFANSNGSSNPLPLRFDSTRHQRYEGEVPVGGLQYCPRTIRIEWNNGECPGYQLKAGDGYIVYMTNGQTGQDQMAPKPMRVVNLTDSSIDLLGYPVMAQTMWGYAEQVDLSNYGLTVNFSEGEIKACTLHMLDRNIHITYFK